MLPKGLWKENEMKEYFPVKEGKVREIYDVGENMILVATDRISCFDVILNNIVTKKGTVLTQMSKFWFDFTKDVAHRAAHALGCIDVTLFVFYHHRRASYCQAFFASDTLVFVYYALPAIVFQPLDQQAWPPCDNGGGNL